MKRILITGMSGTGKSSVIVALAELGYKAVDLDSPDYSEWVDVDPAATALTPEPNRDWQWRIDRVQLLLSTEDADVLFVSGCAENMTQFLPQFDHIVLLSAPPPILVERLTTRTNNDFGKQPGQIEQVLALQQSVEPLLRSIATLEIDTRQPLDEIVTQLIHL